MVLTENIGWTTGSTDDQFTPRQNMNLPISSPLSVSKSSRLRGRPRKCSDHQTPSEPHSLGMLEARKTWETAQLLGISSHDDEAVLSGLRKSKRILLLEGNGA